MPSLSLNQQHQSAESNTQQWPKLVA